uniref:Protein kinase domain-containing protein n=2 Tax=Lepeophtheirus salmonis TaxID=72036 RepID=A0A0K2VA38_LEPSM
MSSVQHPNIIHIYEVFENKEKMVLVMEMANGGELYDFLSDKKCLAEHEARRIFRQIATAVFYCHKHKICHRDLKLENILLDENGSAKIADFGLSNVFGGESLLNTFCGSPLYASPEIVKGSPYEGPEVDCWSLGVLLYTLVYGAMPFDGSNFKRLVRQITTGDYYEPKEASRASSLIRSMLTVQPEMRAKVEDICAHWWVNETYSESCLTEAEYLASLTPVRLDLLLGVSPCPKIKEKPKIGQMEKPLSIEEIVNEEKPEVNEHTNSKDIPKEPQENIKDTIDRNGRIKEEKRIIELIESESSRKSISPIPSENMALINEADSGVMIESVHEIEDNNSVESESPQKLILDLEKAPVESISLNIGFKCEPEANKSIDNNSIPPALTPSLSSSSTPPPPPPPPPPADIPPPPCAVTVEQIKPPSHIPQAKVIKERTIHEVNGKMEETSIIPKAAIKEVTPPRDIKPVPLAQTEKRDKSPTPPPTPPPPPPPPPPSTQNLKPIEKLKVDLQPLITQGLDEMTPLSPDSSQEKDQISDSLHSSKTSVSTPEKRENRDSKVIKAAQYWNNFIGDVISKSKSSDGAKGQPKPKKIVSAGVGLKGMNELKTTFENSKEPTEKRSARKSSVGGCNPGLKVTDAKNVFEIKAQQPPTPVIYRRNSLAKDGKKSTWSKPKPCPTTPGLENETLLQQIKLAQIEPKSKLQLEQEVANNVSSSPILIQEKQSIPTETPNFSPEVKKSKTSSTKKVTKDNEGKESQSTEEPRKPKITQTKESKTNTAHQEPIKTSDILPEKSSKKVETTIKEPIPQVPHVPTPMDELQPVVEKEVPSLINSIVTSPPPPFPQPIQENPLIKQNITEQAKPILRQAKSLDASLSSNMKSKSQVELPPLITNDNQIQTIKPPITSSMKSHSLDVAELEDTTNSKIGLLTKKDEFIKPKENKISGNKPRPSKLSKPKAVQHFENKMHSMTQPKVVSTGGKKDESLELLESGKKEKLSKSVEETPKVPHVVPVKPLIANNLSDSRKDSSSASDVVLKRMEKVTSNENINSTVPSANSPVIENSLKIIGTPVPSRPTLSTSIPPLSKAPPPSTPPVLQTPSQIQSPFIKTNAQEKYVPITLERDTIKESSNAEGKTIYHIPVQVESPSIINNIEDKCGNYYPTNSLSRRRWGSRKKRMSTAYSDSSMSDDDGSFFQYPSGLQKQISLGKHGLETAPMFRLRKTRPPFTLQRESSFSSDGEDELEDDGFREMTAENLFSTLLTRVKSLTRRIHDEHEEHINTWHQNQRIVNHPLNPGDTHARLERSALRNSIKRLPMNKRPTYDETPLPSTIPSENLDLACGVSVTSKQRSRPGYLPHPNAERIIPINLVNSHDKFDQYYSASPPIKRINDIMIPSNDLTYGEEDRQRRVSRFLRPDFYDTPKEDSIYAKMKELEEEEKRKSRFLKKIQARNASESCDVLSPLSSLSNQDDVIMPLHTPSNGEGCEPIQLRKGRSADLDNIREEDSSNYLLHGRRTTPLLKRGLSETKGRTSPSLYGMDSTQSHPNTKDNLSKLLTRRSISSELFADDFFNHNPRTITRRSISKDLHDTAEDLRLRNATTWNEFEPKSTTTPPIANHHRSSRNQLPRHSNSFTRSDWRRTSVPERGKDFKTLPRNYVHFD